MISPEEKESLKEIKKEVLNYLKSKGLSIGTYSSTYHVGTSEKPSKDVAEARYYQSLYNYKLNLYFSSEVFNPENEYNNLFAHLYNNMSINKNHLLNNLNDLTDGYWKKDIKKFLNGITKTIEEKQDFLLNINNAELALNTKNIKQIHDIFKDLPKNDKIDFWVKFFSKRKRALSSNKGGSEIHNFLTEEFTREEIKNNFLNLSPYINDLFENNKQIEVFSHIDNYQRVLPFNPKLLEKALKVPGLNAKKLNFELPKTMNWLASIMGYTSQLVDSKNGKDIQFILYANEPIQDDIFKQFINDYMLEVKNNNGKFFEKEEDFGKWYMKNKLDKKLVTKEVEVKAKPRKI